MRETGVSSSSRACSEGISIVGLAGRRGATTRRCRPPGWPRGETLPNEKFSNLERPYAAVAIDYDFLCPIQFVNPSLDFVQRYVPRTLDAAELPLIRLATVQKQRGIRLLKPNDKVLCGNPGIN